MGELVRLSASEESFVQSLLKGKKHSLAELVPEDIDAREALTNIRESTGALRKLGRATSVIGAYLGKVMAIVAKRPEIWEKAGYASFSEFESKEILDKIGRGTGWNYRSVAEAFPGLSLDEISSMKTTNLIRAAKVVKATGATESQKKKILENINMPVEEFTEWIENQSGLSSKGDTSTASITLIGSAAQVEELKAWLNDKGFREWAGTENPLGMVLAAIQEATTQFASVEAEQEENVVHSGQPREGDGW